MSEPTEIVWNGKTVASGPVATFVVIVAWVGPAVLAFFMGMAVR